MAYLPPMNGGRLNASISSTLGGSAFGASLISTGTMNLVAGSNITLSQAAGNISFQGPNAHNISFGGNMAGIAAQVSTGTLSLYGGNNITLSQNANAVTINGPTAGGGSINFSAGTTSSNLASVRFADSNGLGFGLNGSVITGSYTQQPMFDAGMIGGGAGSTLGTSGSTNTNGLALIAGNNITLSQSTNAGGAAVNISGPSFVNGNGFSFGSNAGSVTASYTGSANINVSAGASNGAFSALTFSNANSVFFGINNGVITASATPDGIQGISAGGASVGNGVVTFSNANNMNFGLNGSVLTASYAGGAGGVALAGGGAVYATGTASLSGSGITVLSTTGQNFILSAPAISSIAGTNINIGTTGSTIGFSVPMFDAGMLAAGNSAGVAGTNTNGVVFVGGNNVTLSQSTNSAGATITANAMGGALSRWQAPDNVIGPISAPVNGNLSFHRMYIPSNLYMSAGIMGGSLNLASSAVNSSISVNMSFWMGIYSMNSSTLQTVSTAFFNNSFTYHYSSTSGFSNYTGMKRMSVQFSNSTNTNAPLPAGEYWVGMLYSGTANVANATPSWTLYGNVGLAGALATSASTTGYTSIQLGFSPLGSSTSASRELIPLQGIYSAATNGLPATVSGGQILNANMTQIMRAANYVALLNGTY